MLDCFNRKSKRLVPNNTKRKLGKEWPAIYMHCTRSRPYRTCSRARSRVCGILSKSPFTASWKGRREPRRVLNQISQRRKHGSEKGVIDVGLALLTSNLFQTVLGGLWTVWGELFWVVCELISNFFGWSCKLSRAVARGRPLEKVQNKLATGSPPTLKHVKGWAAVEPRRSKHVRGAGRAHKLQTYSKLIWNLF